MIVRAREREREERGTYVFALATWVTLSSGSALVAAKNCTLHLGNVVGMYRVFPFAAVWLADKNGRRSFASGFRFPLSSLLFSLRLAALSGNRREPRRPLPAWKENFLCLKSRLPSVLTEDLFIWSILIFSSQKIIFGKNIQKSWGGFSSVAMNSQINVFSNLLIIYFY